MRSFTLAVGLSVMLGLSALSARGAVGWTAQEATGEATLVAADRARARTEALANGLRQAVQQAVGTMMSADALSANGQLVSDRIFSHAAHYVQNYQVLKQEEQEG